VLPGHPAWARRDCAQNRGRRPRLGSLLRAALCLAAIFAATWDTSRFSASYAQDAVDSRREENNLKLAFLFNFGRYVSWPAEAFSQDDSPFVIGVLGPDPFDGALERVAASRKIQGRTILVRHFAAATDYRPCQMLFMTRTVTAAERDSVLRKTAAAAILVVGEAEGFAVAGGGINLYRDQENVRFEINLEAIRAHGLQADAKLLSLARIVKGN
jgi:hypothetical protein